jgi:hypothetical protein
MSRFVLPKGVRNMNSILDDYRPKKWRQDHIESDSTQSCIYEEVASPIDEAFVGYPVEEDNLERSGMNGFDATPFSPAMESASVNLRGYHDEPGCSRLDEIAKVIRTLTYGEILELAESVWKVNSHGSDISESDLPDVLHRWSASQRQ